MLPLLVRGERPRKVAAVELLALLRDGAKDSAEFSLNIFQSNAPTAVCSITLFSGLSIDPTVPHVVDPKNLLGVPSGEKGLLFRGPSLERGGTRENVEILDSSMVGFSDIGEVITESMFLVGSNPNPRND